MGVKTLLLSKNDQVKLAAKIIKVNFIDCELSVKRVVLLCMVLYCSQLKFHFAFF